METENIDEEIYIEDSETDHSIESPDSCYHCRLFIKGTENGKYKSDFCNYYKIYLNYSHSACRYFSDNHKPARNFKKELGKGHTVGKGKKEEVKGRKSVTFDDL